MFIYNNVVDNLPRKVTVLKMSNNSKNNDTPDILLKFNPEQIVELANETKYCTECTGQCFYHELCPVSFSTACCLHCKMSLHSEASKEDMEYIDENFICKNPRCFRAVAVLFLGKKLKESRIENI